jgi:hypothetical protein
MFNLRWRPRNGPPERRGLRRVGMTADERKAARDARSTSTKDKTPLAERGKNPERIQRRQMNALRRA